MQQTIAAAENAFPLPAQVWISLWGNTMLHIWSQGTGKPGPGSPQCQVKGKGSDSVAFCSCAPWGKRKIWVCASKASGILFPENGWGGENPQLLLGLLTEWTLHMSKQGREKAVQQFKIYVMDYKIPNSGSSTQQLLLWVTTLGPDLPPVFSAQNVMQSSMEREASLWPVLSLPLLRPLHLGSEGLFHKATNSIKNWIQQREDSATKPLLPSLRVCIDQEMRLGKVKLR